MMHFGANHFAANHFAARHFRSARAVAQVGGGGMSRGWANERAILEASFQRPKQVIEASTNKVARRVAKKLTRYLDEQIDITEIAREVAALKIEAQTRQSLRLELEAAALELEAFVQDEQEAIEVLMMAMEYDEQCLIT